MDPEVRAYLDAVAASGVPPVEQLTPLEARLNYERATPLVGGPPPPVSVVEDFEVAGVPVRRYAHAAPAQGPLVVWFHGGGWVVGNLETHDIACRHLALAAGVEVMAVDYRLAPEHQYPAALEDCWAVFEAMAASGRPIVVGGDSAGGQLAASVALRARDRGLPLVAQVLAYPVADADFSRASYAANSAGFGLTATGMRWYWDHYVPDPGRRLEPDAAPLRAPTSAGVAPALVLVCELDPLRDEGLALAERMEADGVRVELHEFEGMIHGFYRMHGVISAAHSATELMARFVRGRLGLQISEA